MRKAVIDLGTNTFHLLIADVEPGGKITEIYRERRFVKLASEGIARIGKAPFARGISALQYFRILIDDLQVATVQAIGTAALRTASNGAEFLQQARETAGIVIQLISGDEEARLITQGVLLAVPPLEDRILIMDIGGGSTEFIIADQQGVHWRQSFPVGVSVLYTGFHHSDPMSPEEIETLAVHLREVLTPLAEILRTLPAHHLVGAAGTFDVLAEVLRDPAAPSHPTSHALKLDGFPELFQTITSATLAERLHTDGIPEQRADMIVVALLLLRFVFQLADIRRVTVSDYALKEGVMVEEETMQ